MKQLNWQILLGISLVILSTALYLLHFFIFRDSHHIFIYLLGDIAFVPIEVLLVTLIIHDLLNRREKRILLKKLNMVIGVFFNEAGTELLYSFKEFDQHFEQVRNDLLVGNKWTGPSFQESLRKIKNYACDIHIDRNRLIKLKEFLTHKRGFLVTLLENQNLLEHESFTDLLWAVFHLADELMHRDDIKKLPPSDIEHIALDLKRAYTRLLAEWISYMNHLKKDYPYLFSLALRTNPFNPKAKPEVT